MCHCLTIYVTSTPKASCTDVWRPQWGQLSAQMAHTNFQRFGDSGLVFPPVLIIQNHLGNSFETQLIFKCTP